MTECGVSPRPLLDRPKCHVIFFPLDLPAELASLPSAGAAAATDSLPLPPHSASIPAKRTHTDEPCTTSGAPGGASDPTLHASDYGCATSTPDDNAAAPAARVRGNVSHSPTSNPLDEPQLARPASTAPPLSATADETTLLSPTAALPPAPLKILWNARWEHDKNPEQFFEVLFSLDEAGLPFRLAVLGLRALHAASPRPP